ncbi:leucine dehydrogenase [Sphingomonas sp. UYAg733]
MTYMTFENGADFQEELVVIDDPAAGLSGVIAIHSTTLGPAAGGCRVWHYDGTADLARDAVRLARGMSYKNALAGLPLGGGKAVLRRPPGEFDRVALFHAFGEAVARLNGRYVTAEDVGTSVADMKLVRERTRHAAGLDALPGRAGGDPSPWTALGVFEAMQAAVGMRFGRGLRGMTVAVQGVGNVGAALCRLLHAEGARLIVADTDARRVARLVEELGAESCGVDEIAVAPAQVFAPCALGGVLNDRTIPLLQAKLICGAANNQLATDEDGAALMRRGITYAPDYVVNAGGIINVSAEYLGETGEQVRTRVGLIAARLISVLREAEDSGSPTNRVADALAARIIADALPGAGTSAAAARAVAPPVRPPLVFAPATG